MMLLVSTARQPNQNPRDPVPKTLGDLLYTDRGKVRVSEKEWFGLVQAIAGGDQLAMTSTKDVIL